MRTLLSLAITLLPANAALSAAGTETARDEPVPTVVLVVGAAGAAEYGERFETWAARWEAAARAAGAESVRIGPEAGGRDRLKSLLASQAAAEASGPAGEAPLWLVFLGHGTFDGERANFNLTGPDVSARDLAGWLEPVRRPTAIVVCAAASGPFLTRLSRPGRIVVTATSSGHEQSFSYFGEHLSLAITDPAADLDKDGQVSLLEAFLSASAAVGEFYASEARLVTEHALVDGNGDGLGTPAAWFRGVRSTRAARGGEVSDGPHAHRLHLIESPFERALPPELKRERDALELRVEELRARKEELQDEPYYAALEELLVQLARVYERVQEHGSSPTGGRRD